SLSLGHFSSKYRGYARPVPGSFRIARILGIDVRVHLSWVLIFLYFSYGLAQEQFPSVFPTSEAKAFIAGAVTALLFFASVVAHEFAHAIVARRFRLPVSSITLFLLGGVASLTKEPTSAKGEFLMAVAGPATSLVIGLVAFFLFNIAGQSMQQERLVRAVGGTRVAQLATTDFVVVPSGTLIGTLVRDYVLPRNLRAIPVVDNGRFVGLVTIADLRKVEQDQWPTTPVDAVM